MEAPPAWYLDATRDLLAETGMQVFSEHLAFHRADGKDLTLFLALPFEEEAVEWVARKYRAVRQALGRPFALENVTYHFGVPYCSLDEADFFRRICEETDSSLLLDVTNLFNNSENHGYDVSDFLDRYPLDRVSQLHLAGGFLTEEGKWEDSHSEPVMEPVWELYEEILRRTQAEIVILERDSKLQPFDQVVTDVDRARELFWKHREAEPGTPNPFPGTGDEGTDSTFTLDPHAPAHAQLRGFVRAMMAWITDDDFKAHYQRDPRGAAATFGLTEEIWRKRFAHCDPASLELMSRNWEVVVSQDAEVQEEYENSEWAAWASQLETLEPKS